MLKVMLIDDEIMALNYMKTLVDWNNLGFEIVTALTSAAKGLDYLKKELVDIIFVDIKMPGMDGLEFSEKALAINKDLEILILTSYGDFDYAKKALNIGVSNYLLKHEIKADNLTRELEGLKEKLTEHKQKDKVILGQLVSKYISMPDIITVEEKEEIRKLLHADKMNIISYLVVLDVPFQFVNTKEQYDNIKEESIVNYMELNYENMLAIYLGNGKWLALKVFEPMISQRQILDDTYIAAYGLQRYVFKQYDRTVSILPSIVFNNIDELPNIYNDLKKVSKYLVFYDKNKILYGRDIMTKGEMGKNKIDEILKIIQEAFIKEEVDPILKEIDMFFGICIRNYDEKAFHYFCNRLIIIVNYFLEEHQLKTIYETNATEINSIYSAAEMHAWIAYQVETAIDQVKEKQLVHYTPKIMEAMKYIHNNYQYDIKIEQVADSVNVSGDYLRHIFKEEVGKGFVEYLTEFRIEKSKSLLLMDKYKLYEIASMVGYRSGTYFSAVFKKVTGMNPQDYR
ncbi:MAG: putative response regulatory protein [Herbinix sp.]|nr:putative response regulatory protein [Herbinix sp.]